MKEIIKISIALFIILIFSQAVVADENKPWERFSFSLGGFISALNSDVRIGTPAASIDIDMEDALGLDSTTSALRAEMTYRFSDNGLHRADFTYFDLRRDSTKVLEKDVEFRGQTYTFGTTANSFFNIQMVKGVYRYSFFQDQRIDLGAGAGLYVMSVDLGIEASGVGAEEESITAPLPVIGLHGNFAITPKLFLKQQIEFFWLEIDEFKGSLVDTSFALEYNAWKNVGLGVGVDSFRLDLEADGKDYPEIDFVGNVKFNYLGLLLYAKVFY